MIFNSINISSELENSENIESGLLSQVLSVFETDKQKDDKLLQRLQEKKKAIDNAEIMFDAADLKKVYSIENIEKICIKYRLRFLDSQQFTAEYPYDAIMKIKAFEKKYNTKIDEFKIIAPFDVFKLTDINADPLLFAKINNNQYYLIHTWGNDLAWYRNIINYPFRSIYNFLLSVLVFAFTFQMLIPFSWFGMAVENEFMMRVWFTTHCFIAFFAFFLFLGSLSFKGFSSNVWQSKFYNEV